MTLELVNYKWERVPVDIGEFDNIGSITIKVISGDEIASVIYKDYTRKLFDSYKGRIIFSYDGQYELYNVATGVNRLNDEAFVKRFSSFDYLCDIITEDISNKEERLD